MRTTTAPLLALMALSIASCQEPTSPATPLVVSPSMDVTAGGRVIQHVSIGSNDLCRAFGVKPGCDANFSLVANKYADGTVKGQWEDEFGKDADGNQLGGVHVSIDCLVAEPFTIYTYTWPIAWVSGVVTKSSSPAFQVGDGVITMALDRSHNTRADGFQDLASFTMLLSDVGVASCEDRPDMPVILAKPFTGQVSIWYR